MQAPRKRNLFKICEICGLRTARNNNEKRKFLAQFPLDPYRCKLWVKLTGKEDLAYVPIEKLHQLKFLCGDHFKLKDFNKKKNRLKRGAIPSQNLLAEPLSDEILQEFPLPLYGVYKDASSKERNTSAGPKETDSPEAEVLYEPSHAEDEETPLEPEKEEGPFSWQRPSAVVPCDADGINEDVDTITLWDDQEDKQTVAGTAKGVGTSGNIGTSRYIEASEDVRTPTDVLTSGDVHTLSALYQCNSCEQDIQGFRFVCLVCCDYDLCAACESKGLHQEHYMLRVPPDKPKDEVQEVLRTVRQAINNSIIHLNADKEIEVKEEISDGEDDPIAVSEKLDSPHPSDVHEDEDQPEPEDDNDSSSSWKPEGADSDSEGTWDLEMLEEDLDENSKKLDKAQTKTTVEKSDTTTSESPYTVVFEKSKSGQFIVTTQRTRDKTEEDHHKDNKGTSENTGTTESQLKLNIRPTESSMRVYSRGPSLKTSDTEKVKYPVILKTQRGNMVKLVTGVKGRNIKLNTSGGKMVTLKSASDGKIVTIPTSRTLLKSSVGKMVTTPTSSTLLKSSVGKIVTLPKSNTSGLVKSGGVKIVTLPKSNIEVKSTGGEIERIPATETSSRQIVTQPVVEFDGKIISKLPSTSGGKLVTMPMSKTDGGKIVSLPRSNISPESTDGFKVRIPPQLIKFDGKTIVKLPTATSGGKLVPVSKTDSGKIVMAKSDSGKIVTMPTPTSGKIVYYIDSSSGKTVSAPIEKYVSEQTKTVSESTTAETSSRTVSSHALKRPMSTEDASKLMEPHTKKAVVCLERLTDKDFKLK